MSNTVLITGDTGFIGKNLVDYLLKNTDYKIVGISRSQVAEEKRYDHVPISLLDFDALKSFYLSYGPFDYVFHLAANPLVKDNSHALLQDNLIATDNILRLIDHETKFVFTSSATVYGPAIKNRSEAYKTNEKPSSLYGCTKLLSEHLIDFYSRKNSFEYVILRLVANVGPHSTHGIVHDLYNKAADVSSDVLRLLGNNPGSLKPYAWAPETAALIHFSATKYSDDIIDISPKTSITAKRVAEIILDELKISKKIEFTGETWSGDDEIVSVNSRFRMSDSEENIRKAIRYYEESLSYRRFFDDRTRGNF